MGFPGGSEVKASASNAGDLGSIPGSGRSPGEGNGNPLQYSGLEPSLDCIVHGVTKSWTGLSNFHFHIKSSRIKLMVEGDSQQWEKGEFRKRWVKG